MASKRRKIVARKRKKRNRRMVISALVVVLAAVALIAAILSGERGRIPTTSSDDGVASATTTVAGSTASSTASSATKPTQVTADGHYVQTDRSVWNLLLVNDWNPMPDNYESTVSIVNFAGESKRCDSRVVEPLRQMLADGNAANASFRLSAASLYRDVDHQRTLYEREVQEWMMQGYSRADAEVKAATEVKRPGTSEHNTGLSVDILGGGYSSLEQSFENTEAFRWLREHCADYGFILRFPKDKEQIIRLMGRKRYFLQKILDIRIFCDRILLVLRHRNPDRGL